MLFNSRKGNQAIVKIINLQQNKISPSGNAQEMFTDAKWAVWYAQGTRVLPTKTDQTITFGAITDKNPGANFTLTATASSKLAVQYTIESGDAIVSGSRVTLGNKAGKVSIQAFQVGNNQFNPASATQTFCIVPATPRITANGSNLVATGGAKYQWYLNGSAVNGLTQSTITPNITGGIYTVRALTDDGCVSAASNAIEVKATILGSEFEGDIKLSIYPNPASDELKIDLPAGVNFKGATFYTPSGVKAMQFNKLSTNGSVNISHLAKGVYVVQIETSVGSAARKIVRE